MAQLKRLMLVTCLWFGIVYSAPQPFFEYANFTSTTGLVLVGSPVQDGDAILICSNDPSRASSVTNESGAVWYYQKVPLRGFMTIFEFNITANVTAEGREGLAFVMHNMVSSPIIEIVGGPGAGLGYGDSSGQFVGGIFDSVALEFDTFQEPYLGDKNANHVSLHTRGSGMNSANESYSLDYNLAVTDFVNTGTKVITITYTPIGNGTFEVDIEGISAPVLSTKTRIEQQIALDTNGFGYIGFTASTGATAQSHRLLSWSYQFLGQTNASTSYSFGITNGTAGSVSSFYIQAVDQFGFNAIGGGDIFVASLASEPSIQFNITDLNNGTYQVSYIPTLAVSTSVIVGFVNLSSPIKNSPFAVTVAPGPVYAPNCVAFQVGTQTGLSGGSAGTQLQFSVQLRDIYNNNITSSSGATVTVSILGYPINVPVSCNFDTGKKDFVCSYQLNVTGTYNLNISIGGSVILNPNQTIAITPGSVVAKNCFATPPKVGVAGYVSAFIIQLVDSYGNNLTTNGGATVSISLNGIANVIGTTNYIGNGQFQGSFEATVAGNYSLKILVNNATISGNYPLLILPEDTVYAASCYAYGVNQNNTVAGNYSSFYVQLRDVFANNISSPHPELEFSISFEDAITSKVANATLTWVYVAGGIYQLQYNVTRASTYNLYIFINDSNIGNSPKSVLVLPAYAYGPNSYAVGSGLANATTTLVEHFLVQAMDIFNNTITRPGDTVAVQIDDSLKQETTIANISDNRRGQFNVSYILKKSGAYSIKVTMNGLPIHGSPFSVKCVWIGLPTYQIVLIGLASVVLVAGVCVAAWIYQIKYRKRKTYTPLREAK